MKSQILYWLFVPAATLLALVAQAQPSAPSDGVIRGRLVDASDAPVAGAAVVLFDRDSVYLDAVDRKSVV